MSTLTNRYIAAVSRAVPESQRRDVEAEVAAAIADLTEARLDTGVGPEDAEHGVLLELGDPMRLAADYSNRPLHLIGPDHFPTYVRLLKVLAATVLPIATLAVITAKLLTGADAGQVAAAAVTTLLELAMQLAFWVTVVFAVIERSPGTTAMHPKWDPSMLPDSPSGRARLGDTVVSVLLALGVAAYLPWQHFRSPFTSGDGSPIPTLDPGLWRSWIPVLLAAMLAMAVLEILRYRAGGWSVKFVSLNAALNLLFAVPVIWLAAAGSLLEPAFVQRLVDAGWANADLQLNATIIVVTAGVVLWDVVDSLRKLPGDAAALAPGAPEQGTAMPG